MIEKTSKLIKYFFLFLLLILLFQPKSFDTLNNKEFEKLSTSSYVSDSIEPYCQGLNYRDYQQTKLSNLTGLEINFIDKTSWYKNIFSIYQSNEILIFDKNKKKYKAEIIAYFKNEISCNFMAEIRVSGDYQDHLRMSDLSTSLDVSLTTGNIDGIVKFKLFLPETRDGESEIIISTIMKELNFLVPKTRYISASINNQPEIVFVFQEKLSREFLEKNGIRNSLLLETSEEFFWENRILSNNNKPLLFAKILNLNWVNLSPYNQNIAIEGLNKYNNLIFKSNGSYLSYDFQQNQEIMLYDSAMYAFDSVHGLGLHNRKFYYDNFENKLVPVFYDSDTQILTRDLNLINCEKISDIAFEETACRNHLFIGAKLLISKVNFTSESIYLQLLEENIEIERVKVENIFNKFISNLKNISETKLIEKNLEPEKISFINNIIQEDKSKEVGFYFLELATNKIKICDYNLVNCKLIDWETDSIESSILIDETKYYFLGSNEPNSLLTNEEDKILTIDNNIKIKNFYGESNISVTENIINIELKSDSKILFYGEGVLENWTINIFGSDESSVNIYRQDQNSLTGCVTFYNLVFKNINLNSSISKCEDSINFLNTSGNLNSVFIENSLFDGLDIDFSNLFIENLTIINSDNDCLDISMSKVKIDKLISKNCFDKGLSIGEKSEIIIDELVVINSNMGIGIKDSSSLTISKYEGTENNLCIAMYRKKEEFGPSQLNIENKICEPILSDFIQRGQELNVKN